MWERAKKIGGEKKASRINGECEKRKKEGGRAK